MFRIRFLIKLFAVAIIVTMFVSITPAGRASADTNSAPAATTPVLTSSERYVLNAINNVRHSAGLSVLTIDPQLEQIARSRSSDMATDHYFSHTTPEGTSFINMINALNLWYSKIAEIINRNNYPATNSPAVAMTGFMNSPLHKPFIMTAAFRKCGVGVVSDANGFKYYTIIFLAP